MLKMTSPMKTWGAILAIQFLGAVTALASSHMDAPLISLDDPANTTDVYAFKSKSDGVNYLTTALSVYPFEEPGVGPNNYGFDERVVYDIKVALGQQSINAGRADLTYRFEFATIYSNPNTILQSYLGVVTPSRTFHPNENRRQIYTLTKIDHRAGDLATVLGSRRPVPPNNQGRVTPNYNIDFDGDNRAMGGASSTAGLDPHTKMRIFQLLNGYEVFAGQRDDAFYGDIQSIFDLDFSFDKPEPFDSQGGFNVHTIVLNIPTLELGQYPIVGVYATTSRRGAGGALRQVGRQGNPLFVEALVAIKDKDEYNRSSPTNDERFRPYAAQPEISALLGVTPISPGLLESIFIPDLIKVDMTTEPARLAGSNGFSRLSVFGNDVLKSTFQDPFNNGGFIPGGWPNGRRFGDDVVDIAVIALGAAGNGPDFSAVNVDKVTENDITFNEVFPYAATPQNGRNHPHH